MAAADGGREHQEHGGLSMSCQCHQIGGPFIAEDPDCIIHGRAATSRAETVSELRARAAGEDDPVILRSIIDELAYIVEELH